MWSVHYYYKKCVNTNHVLSPKLYIKVCSKFIPPNVKSVAGLLDFTTSNLMTPNKTKYEIWTFYMNIKC